MKPPLVYIAGPYTKPDPVKNTHRMIQIADRLLDLGVVPVVPHLTLFWHFLRPRSYQQWLDYDLQIMARCDLVLRVPGESQGADGEVEAALAQGQPVIHSRTTRIDDCVDAVTQWLRVNSPLNV